MAEFDEVMRLIAKLNDIYDTNLTNDLVVAACILREELEKRGVIPESKIQD